MAAWLTTEDEQNYGRELLDVSQRAALHALAPALQQIQEDNAALRQRLAKESRHRLDQAVEQAIPTYREIDRDSGWHRWLLGHDELSGEVRQRLLNAAIQRGDSSSVIAFFKAYQRASGNQSPGPAATTSGRARSAPSGRVYSRDEIKRLYELHRTGQWRGSEAEWAQQEHDFYRAQREGRVAGGLDLFGK